MSATRSPRPAHLVALLLVTALAACAPGPAPTPTPTPSASSSATASGTATSTATPPATSGPVIQIDSPMADARVTVPVTASGTANTFEAALTLQLLTEAGDTLCVRQIMATSGSGTEGTWQTDLAFVPPDSDQPTVLRAYELSAEDGSPINVVEVPVVVTPERPPIIIVTPVCGDTVAPGGQIAVTGRAQVFEAQFTLELRDAAGTAVLSQEVTAESGTEESNFSALLTMPADLPGGFYDLVGYNTSAKDGSVQYEFPVQILVQ
ncbi:Gmad2 immunoglobulin-like domain-containing protein [Cryobacterium arcticum]|uniref:Bacterial spore germination immunoglobulin-like domain-containing protein n=1 Tax=Cryobacterium arcticum TaxID=670052 RepID=A0A317ZXP6_9MICO|nr:Gmad2 immunoglobulin-like domain-containing protein [Cryobacterium arcticum]PXA72173.1 hypothetical protein CTB96_04555 [Cryobacterium arcticum]